MRLTRSRLRLGALALLAAMVLAGCGDEARTVRGRMVAGAEATDVYVVGQPIRSVVEGDSFRLTGVEGDTVELEFTEGEDRLGRMRIEEWTGAELRLEGVWLDDGTAFAARLGSPGSAARVNGFRMQPPEDLPGRVEVEAVVLAASGGGDALVVRPLGGTLPDLQVVLTPGTAVEGGDPDEDHVDLDFGDSLRIEGIVEGGYVVATRVVLPSADGDGADGREPHRRDRGQRRAD